jgi:hypothetical protein
MAGEPAADSGERGIEVAGGAEHEVESAADRRAIKLEFEHERRINAAHKSLKGRQAGETEGARR